MELKPNIQKNILNLDKRDTWPILLNLKSEKTENFSKNWEKILV